jgi:two-component system OmpR family sensor kinase
VRHVSSPSRWDRVSLRTKITGVTVLLLTAGLTVAGIGTMTVLRSYLVDEIDRRLKTGIAELSVDGTIDLADTTAHFENASSPFNPYYLAVLDAEGSTLDDYFPGPSGSRPVVSGTVITDVLTNGSTLVSATSIDRSAQWRLLLTPVTLDGSGDPAILVVASDLADANKTVAQFAGVFLFFALTVIILGGAMTRLFVTTTFTPLRRVEATAARFADGDYSQRMSGAPPNTEVGRLTRSLNTMLARIDRAFDDRAKTIDQMRRFVGDASHELRTPLVTVRGYAELYRMGALPEQQDVAQAMERIEKEAIRMTELVQDLLELARLDETKPLQLERVDLLPIARDAARDTMAAAPERVVSVIGLDSDALTGPVTASRPVDVDIARPHEAETAVDTLTRPITLPAGSVTSTPGRGAAIATGPIAFAGALSRLVPRSRRRAAAAPEPVELPEPAPDLDAVVLGEENKIRQVVANLLGNALRFSPESSPLEIGVGVDPVGRRAVIAVIDHGDGVPPQIRDKIFQRFWRADTSRARETGGSGLGLAIVAAIVNAHQGAVDVVETPGGGATFRVWLPLVPSVVTNPSGVPSTPSQGLTRPE